MLEVLNRKLSKPSEDIPTPAPSSRERVGRAVITQAVKDIVENNRRYVDFYNDNWGSIRCVDHALWFINDEAVDIGSYTWYCVLVGIDPEWIRGAVTRGDWALLEKITKIPLH